MKMGMFYMFFRKSISGRKGRIFLSSLSVALAVTVITALTAMTAGIGVKLGEELKTYGANIVVSSQGTGYLDYEHLARIDNMEGVIDAEAQILGMGEVRGEMLEIIGMDLKLLNEKGWRIDGTFIGNRFEVFAGSDLKTALDIEIGQSFPVHYGDRRIEVTLGGFIETGGPGDRALFMQIGDTGELMSMQDRVSVILVTARPGVIERVASQIKGSIKGLAVKTVKQVAGAEEALLHKVQLLMVLVTMVVLFAAVISVGSTMGTNVLERREEIGVMMAVGATAKMISRFYYAEAVVTGIIGGLSGYGLGIASAQILSKGAFGSHIDIPFYSFIISLTAGLVIPLLSSYFPVKNAVSQNPALVLRGE